MHSSLQLSFETKLKVKKQRPQKGLTIGSILTRVNNVWDVRHLGETPFILARDKEGWAEQ
jgi:hypothetical protein